MCRGPDRISRSAAGPADSRFVPGLSGATRRSWWQSQTATWERHAMDVNRIRSHFDFPRTGRVVTNNAATTQPPRELVDLHRSLLPWYDNVHRGQSTASRRTTELFESSYDTIAAWLNAPSR